MSCFNELLSFAAHSLGTSELKCLKVEIRFYNTLKEKMKKISRLDTLLKILLIVRFLSVSHRLEFEVKSWVKRAGYEFIKHVCQISAHYIQCLIQILLY